MGTYTHLRFKGIVKPEFRHNFEHAALHGEWNNLEDNKLRRFSYNSRSHMIPCGYSEYFPDSWREYYYDENGKRVREFECEKHLPDEEVEFWEKVATDGFERQYDPDTGYWAFQCSLKNYEDTIEEFLELCLYFVESIKHCETLYEYGDSKYHTLDSIRNSNGNIEV